MSLYTKEYLVPRTCAALLAAIIAAFAASITLLPASAWAYTVEVTDINGNSLEDTVDVNTLSQGIIVHIYSREPGMMHTIYDDVGRCVCDGFTILETDNTARGNVTVWLSFPSPKPGKTYTLYLAGVYGGGTLNGVEYDPTSITFTAGGGQDDEGDNGAGSGGAGDAEGGSPEPEDTGAVSVVGGDESPGDAEGQPESGDDGTTGSANFAGPDEETAAITGGEVGDVGEQSGTDRETEVSAVETSLSNREAPEEQPREESAAPTQQAQEAQGDERNSSARSENGTPEAESQGDDSSSPVEGNNGGEGSLGSEEFPDSSKRGLAYHVAQAQRIPSNGADLNHVGNYQIDISGLPYLWVFASILLLGSLPSGAAFRAARFRWDLTSSPTRLNRITYS